MCNKRIALFEAQLHLNQQQYGFSDRSPPRTSPLDSSEPRSDPPVETSDEKHELNDLNVIESVAIIEESLIPLPLSTTSEVRTPDSDEFSDFSEDLEEAEKGLFQEYKVEDEEISRQSVEQEQNELAEIDIKKSSTDSGSVHHQAVSSKQNVIDSISDDSPSDFSSDSEDFS